MINKSFFIFWLIFFVLFLTAGFLLLQGKDSVKLSLESSSPVLPLASEAGILPYEESALIEQGLSAEAGPLPLENPPKAVKALYFTSWSVYRSGFADKLLNIASTTAINAAVIDLKDFSGFVNYNSSLPLVEKYRAKKVIIKEIEKLVETLHQRGIYLIARLALFQDPVLAKARPDLALQSREKLSLQMFLKAASSTILNGSSSENASSTLIWPEPAGLTASTSRSFFSQETLWYDDVGLAWIDPASAEAWAYYLSLAQEAASLDFDEINFDYIRFPSDGDLKDALYPFWSSEIKKRDVLKDFFQYLRKNLPEARLSIDLFGQVVVDDNDLGVGQYFENALSYFDYVCPMVYPSHFAPGFFGFLNPAEHPYEIVNQSLLKAKERINLFQAGQTASSAVPLFNRPIAELRPWLQDFDLGADYTAEMVRKEIQAVKDSLADDFNGFFLWNSASIFTLEALRDAD